MSDKDEEDEEDKTKRVEFPTLVTKSDFEDSEDIIG
jgi:hypothetical protein